MRIKSTIRQISKEIDQRNMPDLEPESETLKSQPPTPMTAEGRTVDEQKTLDIEPCAGQPQILTPPNDDDLRGMDRRRVDRIPRRWELDSGGSTRHQNRGWGARLHRLGDAGRGILSPRGEECAEGAPEVGKDSGRGGAEHGAQGAGQGAQDGGLSTPPRHGIRRPSARVECVRHSSFFLRGLRHCDIVTCDFSFVFFWRRKVSDQVCNVLQSDVAGMALSSNLRDLMVFCTGTRLPVAMILVLVPILCFTICLCISPGLGAVILLP